MCVLFRKLSGGHCQLGWRTEDKTPQNKYKDTHSKSVSNVSKIKFRSVWLKLLKQ